MTDIRKIISDWDEYWSYDKGDEAKKRFFAKGTDSSVVEDENSMFHNKLQWDVFLYSMAIGRYLEIKQGGKGGRKPLSKRTDAMPVKYLKIEQISIILGVVFSLDDVDLSILNNPREIRDICEEYANAGVEELIRMEKTKDNDNPLSEYEKELRQFLDRIKNG